jgi:hypothetical protein
MARSFKIAIRAAGKFFRKSSKGKPRFFAFDSFEGLSKPNQITDGHVYHEGQYYCTKNDFKRNIHRVSHGWDVIICDGYFDDSLNTTQLQKHRLTHAAFIMIDCDLYEPTLQALRFITPILQTGAVIYFDDWFFCRGSMARGEAAACAKWLSDNPSIKLIEFGSSAVMSKYFIVNIND